jgi:hypothetical protein
MKAKIGGFAALTVLANRRAGQDTDAALLRLKWILIRETADSMLGTPPDYSY